MIQNIIKQSQLWFHLSEIDYNACVREGSDSPLLLYTYYSPFRGEREVPRLHQTYVGSK